MVRGRQACEAVRPFEKLVAEARSPPWRQPRRIINRLQPLGPCIAPSHQDRKRIVEPEWCEERPPGLCVEATNRFEYPPRILVDGLMEDGSQRRAGVLHVDVDVAG